MKIVYNMSFIVCLYVLLFEHRQGMYLHELCGPWQLSFWESTMGSCSRDHMTYGLHHWLSAFVTPGGAGGVYDSAFHPIAADRSRSRLESESGTAFKGPSLLLPLSPPSVLAYISLLGFRPQRFAGSQKKNNLLGTRLKAWALEVIPDLSHVNQNFWKIGCGCRGWWSMHKPRFS